MEQTIGFMAKSGLPVQKPVNQSQNKTVFQQLGEKSNQVFRVKSNAVSQIPEEGKQSIPSRKKTSEHSTELKSDVSFNESQDYINEYVDIKEMSATSASHSLMGLYMDLSQMQGQGSRPGSYIEEQTGASSTQINKLPFETSEFYGSFANDEQIENAVLSLSGEIHQKSNNLNLDLSNKVSRALTESFKKDLSARAEVSETHAINQKAIQEENMMELLNLTQNLLTQVEKIISTHNEVSPGKENNTKLVKLLEQWTEAYRRLGGNPGINKIVTSNNEKANTIVSNLLQTFQKRATMESAGKYKSQAAVSSADVSKWIKQALERNPVSSDSSISEFKQTGQSAMQMSKVEQYTIHMQQTNQTTEDGQQLVKEFERVLQTSKFLKGNGSTELLLKLKPGGLGEITIKMMEINGELTVKINVLSQSVKDVLEGNLHQLRHMFAPSQVSIEKLENHPSFHDSYQLEDQRESFQEDSSGNNDTPEKALNESAEEEQESIDFFDLLTSEKEQV